MKENYSNRQRKIYSDYVDYSTENLLEMVNSKKCIDEVTEILEDILIERNANSSLTQETEPKNTTPPANEIRIIDPSITSNPLYGVKGWLKFFVVMNLYVGPIFFIISYVLAWAGYITLAKDYPNILIVGAINTAVGLYLINKAIHIAKDLRDIKERAVQNAKSFLTLVFVWNIISIPISFLSGLEGESLIIGAIKQLVLGGIGFAIWYSYFNVSKRVKLTYPDWYK
jgi:hypothetical protein